MRKVLLLVVVGASLVGASPAAAADSYFATVGGILTTGRMYAAAAPLPGGKVLVAGGYNGSTQPLTAEVYDPATDQFTETTNGPGGARTAPGLAPLPDGRVLLAGGQDGPTFLTSATIFDPVGGTFGGIPSTLSTARSGPGTAPLPDGSVLFAGGQSGLFSSTQSTEAFNPDNQSFGGIPGDPQLSAPRVNAAAVALEDGRVLVVGGAEASAASAEVYDPVAATFSGVPSAMTAGRSDPAAALLGNGRVLVVGGDASAEIFDPATEKFTAIAATMSIPRDTPLAVPLANGTVLITGGYPGSGPTVPRSAEVFVPAPEARIKGAQPFGVVDVGTTTATRTVTISNVGAQDLTMGSALTLSGDDPGDFVLGTNTCAGATLSFRDSCTIDVTFKPSADGARTATIALATNEPTSSVVKLSGTGDAPGTTTAPGTVSPPPPPATTPAGQTPTGTGVKVIPVKRVTCARKRVRGRTRITCTVKLTKPRAAKATLRRGKVVVARGRVTKGGRVTLTTALKPKPGTYTLRIGTTKITIRLR